MTRARPRAWREYAKPWQAAEVRALVSTVTGPLKRGPATLGSVQYSSVKPRYWRVAQYICSEKR